MNILKILSSLNDDLIEYETNGSRLIGGAYFEDIDELIELIRGKILDAIDNVDR